MGLEEEEEEVHREREAPGRQQLMCGVEVLYVCRYTRRRAGALACVVRKGGGEAAQVVTLHVSHRIGATGTYNIQRGRCKKETACARRKSTRREKCEY